MRFRPALVRRGRREARNFPAANALLRAHRFRMDGLRVDAVASFKWNMGWMNDTLRYAAMNPPHRRCEHRLTTISLVHARPENFTLPISRDEVVHGRHALRPDPPPPGALLLTGPAQ